MDIIEKMAADIAMKLNGGEWSDGKWYSEGHRKAWIEAVKPHADEIERLRTGNRLHLELAEIQNAEIERLREALHEFVLYGCPVCHGDCSSANPYFSGCPMTKARSALQQKDSE